MHQPEGHDVSPLPQPHALQSRRESHWQRQICTAAIKRPEPAQSVASIRCGHSEQGRGTESSQAHRLSERWKACDNGTLNCLRTSLHLAHKCDCFNSPASAQFLGFAPALPRQPAPTAALRACGPIRNGQRWLEGEDLSCRVFWPRSSAAWRGRPRWAAQRGSRARPGHGRAAALATSA